MRVLSVGNRYPPWSLGGYERTWASTVTALRAAGHACRVLTTLPDPSDRAGAAPDDVHRELAWYWRDHRFPPRGWRACLALERHNRAVLARHLDELQPEAIMWWAMGGMSLSLIDQARRAGVPALAVVGDDWIVYGPRVDQWTRCFSERGGRGRLAAVVAPAVDRLTGVPTRLALDRGARWSLNSAATLAAARSAGWRLPEATVDHPGVDPARFAPVDPSPWSGRLLYCGRIDARKGIATAVRALSTLPAQTSLRVHGTGDERHVSELRALAAGLGLAGRVTFDAGEPDAVAGVYAACDAVLFPVTWREPWGLVPLEAMAVGRPVIATRAGGGPAEYLRNGENCLQVDPDASEQLAAAAARLAGDAGLRAHLIDGGRRTAARFSERGFHEALARALERTVAAGPLP